MTYAFLIALGVGGLGIGLFAALWQAARAAYVQERAEGDKVRAELAAASTATRVSEAERARLEGVIALLKSEVSQLERELIANQDPAAVRERLRRLFGSS